MMSFLRSAPGEEPVLLDGLLPATPERVFQAWTDPEELRRWFGLRENGLLAAEVDLRVGGRWRFEMKSDDAARHYLEGAYLEIERPTRLVFTWRHVVAAEGGAPEPSPDSRVTLAFEPQGAATRLRLRHEAIEREPARLGVGRGWEASLGKLAALLSDTGTEEGS